MCTGSGTGSAILSTGGKTVRRKGNPGGGAGIGLSLGRGSPPGKKLGGKAARGGKGSGKGGCAPKIAGCVSVGLVASLPLLVRTCFASSFSFSSSSVTSFSSSPSLCTTVGDLMFSTLLRLVLPEISCSCNPSQLASGEKPFLKQDSFSSKRPWLFIVSTRFSPEARGAEKEEQ